MSINNELVCKHCRMAKRMHVFEGDREYGKLHCLYSPLDFDPLRCPGCDVALPLVWTGNTLPVAYVSNGKATSRCSTCIRHDRHGDL